MLTKIKIPVLDTESGNYDFKGKLTDEVYADMLDAETRKYNAAMERAAYKAALDRDDYLAGRKQYDVTDYNDSRYNVQNVSNSTTDFGVKYTWSEAEALILDGKKNDISEEELTKHIDKQDMFIILLNVNPNGLEPDAESEIRFWTDDSRKIHNDNRLDNKHKILMLPARDIQIEINEQFATLTNCKVLQNYSDSKFPYYLGIIVEKITY